MLYYRKYTDLSISYIILKALLEIFKIINVIIMLFRTTARYDNETTKTTIERKNESRKVSFQDVSYVVTNIHRDL